MRRSQCTVSRRSLQAEIERELLGLLPWKDYGRKLKATVLVRLLALMATLPSSLSAVCRRCQVGVCWETVRQALRANLPATETMADSLRLQLQARLPRRLRRGKRRVAIDVHERCYYGNPQPTSGVRGGRRKAGTTWFWAYATACRVDEGERWTVGVT